MPVATYQIQKKNQPQILEVDLIVTPNGYGFGGDWQLLAKKGSKNKVFYLGQDAKVCDRIIGATPKQVAETVGSNDLSKKSTRRLIAGLILEAIGLNCENEDSLFDLQPWAIAAE